MLHTKFRGNRPAGSGKENFGRAFIIYGRGGHFNNVNSIMFYEFSFPCTGKLSYKIWFRTAQKFLIKSGLNFCMYTTFGQGQEMTLTFNTHIPS